MKVPCKITLRGDKVYAKNFIGAAQSQLRILENQMDFQGLKQGTRKVQLNPRITVEALVCFNLREVIINCLPTYIEEEKIKELREPCSIQLLTFKIEGDCINNLNYIPEMWEEETCIKERGFCLTPDEECNIKLKPRSHPWPDRRNHHVSQCRYVYTEGEITRKVSLFHYDSYPTLRAVPVYKIIRVKGHQDSPDLVLRYLIEEPGIEADYYGALSKDLKTLYVSLFVKQFKNLGRDEWFLYYSKYENIDGKWERTKSGMTPTGMSFRDNAIDRLGRCGCWHYADDFITHNYSKSLVNCLTVSDGWMKHGTLNEAKYKTFDIEIEDFIESEKMVGLHLNPVTEEFVTCKSLPGTNYFYNLANGSPNYFIFNMFSCHCTICPAPWWHTATHERSINYRYFYGGWSREYTLFSGLETYPPLWDTFFYDGLRQHKKTDIQLVGNCPSFSPPRIHTCDGTAYKFDGGEMRALMIPFTSFVYAGHVKVGTEIVQSGYYYSPPGYISGVPCHGGSPTWEWTPHLNPCGNVESVTQDVNIDNMELLSPFEMTLQTGDQIGNTFISYDEETDYLLRGIHYKPLGGEWTWKIYARLMGHEGSPYNCPEKDITNELKELLSEEYFYNIETIIFL
ncbi:MAG: hypothetical protein IMF11_09065 [Proteobacteria bacterium]|nr:hypothetical protein [Pseudomonadota bacterium]